MKKTIFGRLGVLALVLTMATTSLISGTMAKYTETAYGTDTATVAKFAYTVTAGGTGAPAAVSDITGSSRTEIDLFSLRSIDTGVKGKDLIAPGTTGSFEIAVNNTSDVVVEDTISLAEANTNNVPVYYTFDNENYSSVYTGNGAADTTSIAGVTLNGNIGALAEAISTKNNSLGYTDGPATYLVTWTWAFSVSGAAQTDAKDTILGKTASAPTVKLDVDVTVTQLDVKPQP